MHADGRADAVRQPCRTRPAIRSISFPAARTSQSRQRIYAWHCAISDRSTYPLECCRCCIRLEQAGRNRRRKVGCDCCSNALTLIKPYVQAIADVGAQSIAVFTDLPEAESNTSPIKVWEQNGRSAKDIGRIRQTLIRVLAVACIIAAIALGTEVIMGTNLTAQQDELARQISARSALGVTGSLGAQRALERRKQDAPSTVLSSKRCRKYSLIKLI